MILAALDAAGGAEYLLRQTKQNPVAFMSLLGKLLPTQLTGKDGGAILNVFDPATLSDAELAARIDRLRRTAIVDGTPEAEGLPDVACWRGALKRCYRSGRRRPRIIGC